MGCAIWYSLVITTILVIPDPVSCLKCISCRCGSSNKNYTQCIENETEEEYMCKTWVQCQTCKDNTTHCLTCPSKRFGLLCTEGALEPKRRKRQIDTDRSTHCENEGSVHNGRMTVIRASAQPLQFEDEDFELPVGTRIHYSCDIGYVLQGEAVLICEDKGYWSEEKPYCIADPSAQCSDPGQITYGSYRNSAGDSATSQVYAVGQLVIYNCQNGYDLVGSREVTCLPSGSWSSKPSCRKTTGTPIPLDSTDTTGNCPDPGSIQDGYRRVINGIPSRSRTFNHGQSLRYFCNQGYELQGDSVLTCLTSGQWSSNTPGCLEKNPTVNCPDPGSIQSGYRRSVIDIPSMVTGTYSNGQSFRYFCDYGYELRGNSLLTCLPSGKWSSDAPSCQDVVELTRRKRLIGSYGSTHCMNEGPIQNGRLFVRRVFTIPLQYVDDYEFPVGTRLHYSCDEGFVLDGTADQICEDTGFWSGEKPRCIEVKCKKFGPVINGRVGVYFTSTSNRRKTIDEESGRNYPVGTSLIYSCDKGYTLRGNKVLHCELTGRWSADEPICIKGVFEHIRRQRQISVVRRSGSTRCLNEGPIPNGRVAVLCVRTLTVPRRSAEEDYEFPVGTRLRYSCDKGFVLQGVAELICVDTGFWSEEKPICIEVKCKKFDPVLNGRVVVFFTSVFNRRRTIHVKRGRDYPMGTSLSYECDYGYILRGNKTLYCESTGNWSTDAPVCIKECGVNSIDSNNPVFFGTNTTPGEWPWTVAIAVNENSTTRFLCSGVLLDRRTVLTVAQCVQESRTYVLYFGLFQLKFKSQAGLISEATSSRIIVHPNFNNQTYENDIALITFKPPVVYSGRIQPICLPTQDSSARNLATGEKGFVSGWETGALSSPLQELSMIQLPVLSEKACEAHYRMTEVARAIITPGMFCAGLEEGIDGFCSMTSGSPMVFYNAEKDSYTLEGLVSWRQGPLCQKKRKLLCFD